MTPRLAVLVSGGGRSLENLVERCRSGAVPAQVALVISDRPGIGALQRAERLEIPARVLRPADYEQPEAFGRAVFACVEELGCELVVLAGFLRLLPIPERWQGRVLNIHPSLLPAFGGQGYYGERVHRAVLERGVQYTGCTVHYVTNEYDQGPILVQRCIPVEPDDTPESLARRVFEEEQEALPEAVRKHLSQAPPPRGARHE